MSCWPFTKVHFRLMALSMTEASVTHTIANLQWRMCSQQTNTSPLTVQLRRMGLARLARRDLPRRVEQLRVGERKSHPPVAPLECRLKPGPLRKWEHPPPSVGPNKDHVMSILIIDIDMTNQFIRQFHHRHHISVFHRSTMFFI